MCGGDARSKSEDGETMRTEEQIKEHYQVEKELADRLRRSARKERLALYSKIYDELFRRVPHHPLLEKKENERARERDAIVQVDIVERFLDPDLVFLVVGAGDCEAAFRIARKVAKVYAVDVSEEITRREEAPENFELILSDGVSIPLPEESVDLAFSNQLMEHLHPDDALEQLQNIYRALKARGIYICLTPNRILGPHDVSRHYDEVATGLHLKEYTTGELVSIFKRAGFRKTRAIYDPSGKFRPLPTLPIRTLEALLCLFPLKTAGKLARIFPVAQILGVRVVAMK